MSATVFSPDLRDIRFVLFEQLDLVGKMSAFERYGDLDRETFDHMLDEAARIATEVVWPTNANGDVQGCSFDGKGNVSTPDGFEDIWETFKEGGWAAISVSEEYGGLQLPHLFDASIHEMMSSANMAFATYPGLTRAAAGLLSHYAPDSVRELVCTKMWGLDWAGTMCLTEAGAGSAVGDARTQAFPTDEPGVYSIKGEKIFITGGDNDLTDNIIHLVLARTPGAPVGTRGLSLFLVPKFEFDAEGNLGERNDAWVQKIEEKMGLHGSATTVLAFGINGDGARGILLGEEGQGMPIMFHMMNEARIGVGVQGLAGAAAGYGLSLSYAMDRIQGTSIANFKDPEAPRVSIVEHPDVRRMLLWQKVHVETMRSFIYSLAMRLDRAENTADEAEKQQLMGLVELMTPICKAYCSDKGFDSAVMAMQVFGGYGYTGEYPVEQVVRDTKIASIWEGTNGIQAIDLLGRKMRMNNGMVFMGWLQEAGEQISAAKAHAELKEPAEALEKALNSVGATAMHLSGLGMQGQLDAALGHATAFLDAMGNVVLGLHALWQGTLAQARLDEGGLSESDQRFYRGKVVGARFYASQILPRAIATTKTIRSNDQSCMDEALFA